MKFALFLSSTVSVLLALIASPTAFAQSTQGNTLTIEQRGDGNRLTVDQSGATGGRIEGLEIDLYSQEYEVEIDASTYDAAGVLVEQRTATETRHTQALRPGDGLSPAALQSGNDNAGKVSMTGNNGVVRFLQRGNDNIASIRTDGAAQANLGQDGNDNRARLRVDDGGLGTILQQGNGNRAWLDVSPDATGVISQIGDGNRTGFAVTGAGTTASYMVYGSNTVTTAAPSVISNGAAVQIIQTQNAGF